MCETYIYWSKCKRGSDTLMPVGVLVAINNRSARAHTSVNEMGAMVAVQNYLLIPPYDLVERQMYNDPAFHSYRFFY